MPADDRIDGPDDDLYDETPPRSIFAATWFRALLVLIVLAVVGAVAVPYILDAMNPPIKAGLASRATASRAAPPAASSSPATIASSTPTSDTSTATTVATDRSSAAERAPASVTTPSATTTTPSATTTTPSASTPAANTTTPSAPPSTTSRKPLARETTALVDRSMPPDRSIVSDRPAPPVSDRAASPTVVDKPSAATVDKTAVVAAVTPEAAKPVPQTKANAKPRAASIPTSPNGTAAARRDWWVQVGAFRDETTAQKVAARLREQNYPVADPAAGKPAAASTPAPVAASSADSGDQYDVLVSGMSLADLNTRLAAKGLKAEASGTSAVVKPSLPLRDAVALSKDLAVDGLKVQVRRAAATSASTAPATPAPAAADADTLYRVRVGGFADRGAAVATLKELEAKGYKPFIARGTP
jgi:hypothetical protein